MRVVISYSYTDDECIVVRVVKTSGILFKKFDDEVVNPWHPRHRPYQLDIMDHP